MLLILEKKTYTKIRQSFNDDSMESATFFALTPPNYFKLGTLLEVNELQKEIHTAGSPDLPSGDTGVSVAKNVKAEKLRILYRFDSLENLLQVV